MWREISIGDKSGVAHFLEIMRQMDGVYRRGDVNSWRSWMRRKAGRIFHYQAEGWEAVLAIDLNRKLGLYRVKTGGFVGDVEPAVVLDVAMTKIGQFMQHNGLSTVYGISRKNLNSEPMNRLLALVPSQDRLAVAIEHDDAAGTALKLSLTEA